MDEAAARHAVEFRYARDDARRRTALAGQPFEREGAAAMGADRRGRPRVFLDDAVPFLAGVATPLPSVGDGAAILANESRADLAMAFLLAGR